MHIPDGFLDLKTAAVAGVIAAAGVGVALARVNRHLPRRQVPMMGLAAAFVFAAQMLNFPVAGGTSGHLLGGTLVAILLGPGAAIIVLATVLVVQCFVFADGGVLALGANILNMGIISSVTGYLIFATLSGVWRSEFGRLVAAAFGSWCATVLPAIVCAGELAVSGKVNWWHGAAAMGAVHILIGIGEAAITTGVLYALWRTRPEMRAGNSAAMGGEVTDGRAAGPTGRGWELAAYGLLVALGLALFASPFASQWPDGLDRVAEQLHFKESEAAPPAKAPLADYQMPGIASKPVATAAAGAIGTLAAFGLSIGLVRGLTRKER